jgi:hypothetical protein
VCLIPGSQTHQKFFSAHRWDTNEQMTFIRETGLVQRVPVPVRVVGCWVYKKIWSTTKQFSVCQYWLPPDDTDLISRGTERTKYGAKTLSEKMSISKITIQLLQVPVVLVMVVPEG